MEQSSLLEAECSRLENAFQQTIANMKMSFPAFEDLTVKALKFSAVLRSTISATGAFIEAFQKVANCALGSKGSTNEIGSILSRLCLCQTTVGEKLKQLIGSISESLVLPLQAGLEDWKKAVIILDRDHTKASKRAHNDIKKAMLETVRLKKKSKKPTAKPEIAKQLENAVNEHNKKYEALEAIERNAMQSALTEELSFFCYFVECLKPVMDCEVAMMAEMTQAEQLMSALQAQAFDPFSRPEKGNELSRCDKKEISSAPPSKVDMECATWSLGHPRKSSLSSTMSCAAVPSSLHASVPGSIYKEKAFESPGNCNTIAVSSNRNLSSHSSTLWPECQEQMQTMPRLSAPSLAAAALPPFPEKSQLIKQCEVASDSSLAISESTSASQHAFACVVGEELANLAMCLTTDCFYAKPTQKPLETTDDVKKTQVPLEGYVNMSQLANLAVQQQKNEMIGTNESVPDCLGLVPPHQGSLADAAILSHAFEIASNTSAVKQTSGCFRRQASEDVRLTGALLRSEFGSAKAHRILARDPSLPPIPKKSSKTAPRSNTGKAITAHDQGLFPSAQAKEYRQRMEEIYEVCMEALPLPPPSLEIHHSNSAVDSAAIDSLPLPPPPEELLQDFGFSPWRLTRRAGSSEMISSTRDRNLVSSQTSIAESRNAKFPEAPVGLAHRRCASDAMFTKDVNSGNEPTSPKSLTAGIQQGSRLKMAIANNRSALQLPASHS